ncbi:M14 family zinc carboxypeptidase [Parabacteroides sp. PF5-9]|uniref:M14 family zinc carboxypeptidase n=1 Tax=Parabacteroides sp. PF5-9 TaxID=1742404 RepID=UPI002474B483|nr:M14 family zinc carboxypeptidase [Parabacteroides sp. PF5-9]MDH6358045.1 murein tripeptide amidase MpaA [Parabacteroides sp. PF5-9]
MRIKYLSFTTLVVFISLFFSCTQQALQKEDFLTYYEKNNYEHTPRYEETIDYCRLLAKHSRQITYTTIGVSPQGREIPLLIIDKDGLTSPEQIRAKGRVVVLAEANIHAGEPDGKDAGLMFIRDAVLFDEHPGLLDNVSFLFIPIINVDGHEDFGIHYRINQNGPVEVGARFTAQRLNMNRDFIKADAPEMRSLLSLYAQWMPELFIDIHVTNGADFQYVSTYGLEHCEFLTPNMLEWSMNTFEKELKGRMEDDGFPLFPYFFSITHVPDVGMSVFPDVFAPQYSNGYASANNRIGLLIENHIYKPYKERVDATYLYLKHALELAGRHNKILKAEIEKADRYVSSREFRKDSLALDYVHNMAQSVPIRYLGWKDTTVISDLSGGNWTYYDRNAPVTLDYHLFLSFTGENKIRLPEAYIIPQEQLTTIELLDIHGIHYERFKRDTILEVETYHFTDAEWSKTPYEGRITLKTDYKTTKEHIRYHAGDIWVSTSQPKVKIIAHMLEPKSSTSLVYWGFYNNFIKAPNEFWISLNYMETKGREMLEEDPVLKAEFETKKKEDPALANDPRAILNFFMTKVRARVEVGVNRYPVGKVYTP